MRRRRIASGVIAALMLSGLLAGPSAAQDADTGGLVGPAAGDFTVSAAGGFEDEFLKYPLTVNGDYIPLIGPWCTGDQLEEYEPWVIWYAPGPAADHLWGLIEGEDDEVLVKSIPLTINGTYTPIVGDFDGNECPDILWYAPGTAKDSIWYGNPDGTWDSYPLTINGTYQAVVGSYDPITDKSEEEEEGCGAWCDDIFWYSTTGGTESIWLGHEDRAFVPATAPQVSYSDYRIAPFADAAIFFHRPGTGADYVWDGVIAGESIPEFSVQLKIDGTYEPYWAGVGLLLYAPGPATDRFITTIFEDGTFTSYNGTINGTYRVGSTPGTWGWPVLLFHAPGTAPDSLWILGT